MGFYSLDALGRDARRNGIQTLPPHINKSDVVCTVEGTALRIGLGFVRNWGAEITEHIVKERRCTGPYISLTDFLRRTPSGLQRPAIDNLIWVGGFNEFGLTRRELLWQAGLWLGPDTNNNCKRSRDNHAQTELALGNPYENLSFPDIGQTEQMIAEYQMSASQLNSTRYRCSKMSCRKTP